MEKIGEEEITDLMLQYIMIITMLIKDTMTHQIMIQDMMVPYIAMHHCPRRWKATKEFSRLKQELVHGVAMAMKRCQMR